MQKNTEQHKLFTAHSVFQIYHLLFQGRIKEVCDLLAQHPDRNPDGQDVSALLVLCQSI